MTSPDGEVAGSGPGALRLPGVGEDGPASCPPTGVSAAVGGRLPDGVAEPVELRAAWWAAERTGEAHPDLVGTLVEVLRAAWAVPLSEAGVGGRWLEAVVEGYRRELWLWVAGERTWEQASTGLAGRASRRLPA